MRKTRSWICPCCWASWYRKKSSTQPIFCGNCKIHAVAGRKFFQQRVCKHQRIRDKLERFKQTYYSKVRNISGMVLRISRETKALWRNVVKCQQRPVFLKRAQLFADSIIKDCWNAPEGKYARYITSRGTIEGSRGGWSTAPAIRLQEKTFYALGEFTSSLLDGKYEIMIAADHPISQMKAILLHEILHVIDHLSRTPHDGHGFYWQKRLAIMHKKFKIRGLTEKELI
jgi:hypothetical protein